MGTGIHPQKQRAMKPVLWLTSWYPTRVHPTNGDFVERHARAVALYRPVIVLMVEKDPSLAWNKTETIIQEEQQLTVYRIYYGTTGMGKSVEKLFSFLQFKRIQKRAYREIVRRFGEPDVVHVQMAMKAGLLALWLKNKFNKPYVVTENWTGYYKESVPNIYQESSFTQSLYKKVLRNSSLFMPVTDDLARTVQDLFGAVKHQAIPNTVDTSLFYYRNQQPAAFRFIHASYLNYQKNPEGMLEAAYQLSRRGYSFELHLVGNNSETIKAKAAALQLLNDKVFIHPAVPYAEVARRMQESSALVLFSRFENLPCIVLEALCCGLPVISSRVGGVAEVVSAENGILVESEDVEALAAAMENMINYYNHYDRSEIAAKAIRLFSYETVGKQYASVYDNITAAP